MATKTKQLCKDCRDDFYNHREGGGECWSFKNAKVVTRYKLDWWTQPITPGAFSKVTTLTCHYAPGRYALYKREDIPSGVKVK